MRSIFEDLEPRKMLDGTPLMFIRGQGGDQGSQHLPAGWNMLIEMQPDGFPNMVLTRDSGEVLRLPVVKPDGSVTVDGTSDADTIAVERVSDLNDSPDGVMALAYFQTADGAVAVNQPFFDTDVFEPFVQQTRATLQESQQRYDDAVAGHDDQRSLDNALNMLNNAKRNNDGAEAALVELKAPHNYIRYRLEGFYDVYVEMNEAMTSNSRIRIDGGGGNDIIAVANNVPMKASLGGGPGADKITSGSRTSMLYGGGGNDRLFSRSKHGGGLDGGKGADRYYNRYGEVQIMARPDGDSVVVDDSPVAVAECGTLGVEADSGRCYFLGEDGAQIDLLA